MVLFVCTVVSKSMEILMVKNQPHVALYSPRFLYVFLSYQHDCFKKFTNCSPLGRHAIFFYLHMQTYAHMLTYTIDICYELLLSFTYVFELRSKQWIKYFITHRLFSSTLFWLQYLIWNTTVYVLPKFVCRQLHFEYKKLRVFYIVEQWTPWTTSL